jgi:hypothetical protein
VAEPDVIVRAIRRTPEGIGVYDRYAPILVKNLRAAGAVVEYEDPPDTRRFLDENSAVEVIAAALALNLLSSAGYDALRWAIGRMGRGARLRLSLRRGVNESDETFDGSVEEALALLSSGTGDAMPEPERRDALATDDVPDVHERRFSTTREVEERLATAETKLAVAESMPTSENDDAESEARAALSGFASALNWAEGGPFEQAVHARMDQAGRWVRERFGCKLHREGNEYFQRCPIALGHNRIGMSVAGLSRKVCSICGEDFSECPHIPGKQYIVEGGLGPLEWCRVCGERDGCEHLSDERYRARLIVIIVEMQLEEVSIVDSPAFRDARITSMSYTLDDLRQALGEDFEPGADVACNRCLLDCDGLSRRLPTSEGQ